MAMRIYNVGGRECWWEESEVPAGAVPVTAPKRPKEVAEKVAQPANKAAKKATK